MGQELDSQSYPITVPMDGSWVYQDVYIGPMNCNYFGPSGIILNNLSQYDMYVKYMEYEEQNGLNRGGILIRPRQTIVQQAERDLVFRIGVRLKDAQTSDQDFEVSCFDYRLRLLPVI